MADLTARFRLVDEMSAALERMAQAGQDMADRIEQGGTSIDSVMGGISLRVSGVARTIDGVATSLDQAEDAQTGLTDAMERAAKTTEELADNENVSAEAKEALAQASQEAEDALNELAAAQERTQQAMDEYDQLLASGTASLDELEQAAQNAADASVELDAANQKAAKAADELADATDKAAEEAEKGSKKGQDAANQLANALTAAGITIALKEIAGAFLEASDAAAEFQMGIMKISTIADTTTTSLSAIQGDIMSLSMETGDSVNELSEAVYSAISASVDTADAVEFTGTATKLAAGGFTDSATAVDVLTTALNAYGLEASQAENISDMLITTQNLGKTTVDELAASVGKVIPIASAYGVEMDNLSAAYAELTKGGIATAEAGTYLKSMLNELGDSGSDVSAVLIGQTGHSFAQLTEQGYSLGDVMAVLGDSVNGDAGAFNELWSSSEAGVGALALYNAGAEQFNTTLDAMQNSMGATTSAYDIMNSTTADAAEDFANAADNLQIAIGQQINPLMDKLYSAGTNVLNLMTGFAEEHPVAVKAITAVGIALGTATIAITGVAAATTAATFATETAIPAIISFGTAVNTALGPIGWAVMGVTALTAAVAAFVAMNEEDLGETEGMTATTREQYYALQDLRDEYEQACEQYGETSEQAGNLKQQVDELSTAFEENRQTVDEFTAEVDTLCESISGVSEDFDQAMNCIQSQETEAMALIQKYDELASKADRTAAEEKALEAVGNELAKSYPEIAEQMDSASMSTDDYVEAMKRACEQEAELQRQQQAQDTYIETLKKQADLEDEIAKAEEEIRLEKERMDNMSGLEHLFTSGEWDDLKSYQAALDELEATQAENDALIAEIEDGWKVSKEAEEEAAEEVTTWQEASSNAYQIVQSSIEELCDAYDEAYQAASEAFAGQFSLFDEASMESETYLNSTVANAQAALDSQLAYWESYGANIETLKTVSNENLGVTQETYNALMAYVQDGSEEAAGLAASMAAAVEAGDMETVANLAQTFEQVNAKQDEIAQSTADWQTNFTEQMDGYSQDMKRIIGDMDLSEEAEIAATSTVYSYAQHILAGKADAVSAAQEVASAVTSALSSAKTNISVGVSSSSVPGHASGTTNAEDIFMAGEEGPELVVGKSGSTVFPTEETDKIVNAISRMDKSSTIIADTADQPISYQYDTGDILTDDHSVGYTIDQSVHNTGDSFTTYLADSSPKTSVETSSDSTETSEKKIVIELAGTGSIKVSNSGGNKDAIVSMLMQNLKPVLMQTLRDEIFEEGDGSYEH